MQSIAGPLCWTLVFRARARNYRHWIDTACSAHRNSPIPARSHTMAVNYMRLVSLLGPVNRLFDLHTGGPRRPVFHDIAQVRPELAELRRQFPAIRQELLSLL